MAASKFSAHIYVDVRGEGMGRWWPRQCLEGVEIELILTAAPAASGPAIGMSFHICMKYWFAAGHELCFIASCVGALHQPTALLQHPKKNPLLLALVESIQLNQTDLDGMLLHIFQSVAIWTQERSLSFKKWSCFHTHDGNCVLFFASCEITCFQYVISTHGVVFILSVRGKMHRVFWFLQFYSAGPSSASFLAHFFLKNLTERAKIQKH